MKIKLVYCAVVLMLSPVCMFYSFKGSIPAHIKSIYLEPVTNESTDFSAAEILDNELNTLMLRENILDIALPDEADSHLEVVISSVTDIPYTVALSDEFGMEEVEEWHLSISAQIIWYDIKRDEILLKKNMTSWGIYAPGVDIGSDNLDNDGDTLIDEDDSDEVGSPRESAMQISVRHLTKDIVNEITNTW